MHITVLNGNNVIPKDEEAIDLWKKEELIALKNVVSKDNFWGPVAETGPWTLFRNSL